MEVYYIHASGKFFTYKRAFVYIYTIINFLQFKLIGGVFMINTRNKKELEQLVKECATDLVERYNKIESGERIEINHWLIWKYFDIFNGDKSIYKLLLSNLKEKGLSLDSEMDSVGDKFTVFKE